MTMLFMDGFDKYGAKADLALRSTSNLSAMEMSVETGAGRFGGKAIKHISGDRLFFPYGIFTSEVRIAFHMKMLGDLTTTAGRWFGITGNSFFGAGGAYLSTPSENDEIIFEGFTTSALSNYIEATRIANPFVIDTWHHIEIHFYGHWSSGTVKLYVDEELLMNFTGNTDNGLSQYGWYYGTNGFGFGPICGTNGTLYDDLVMWNAATGFNSALLGAHRIDTLSPIGPGAMTEFTPSAGANWENVDDPGFHDGDATTNTSSTIGNEDTFETENLTRTPDTIHGVQVTARGKSSTDAPINTYTHKPVFFTENPITEEAWTVESINGYEIGYVHQSG